MKKTKTVTSREFQHGFSDLAASLKPGESIAITKHGKSIGCFTKASQPRKAPDYLGNLARLGHSARAGQKLIEEICDLS